MLVFQQVAEVAFNRRLAEHLQQKYASFGVELPMDVTTIGNLPFATLLEMVRQGIARARAYGMAFESSFAAFLAIMIEFAPNFDEHPQVQQILKDESLPPDARLDRVLDEAILEQQREEIKQNYDSGAWALKAEE